MADNDFYSRTTKELILFVKALKKKNREKNIQSIVSSMASCTIQEKNCEEKENPSPVRSSCEEISRVNGTRTSLKENQNDYGPGPIRFAEPIPLNIRALRRVGEAGPKSVMKVRNNTRREVLTHRRIKKLETVNLNRGLVMDEEVHKVSKSGHIFDLTLLNKALPAVSHHSKKSRAQWRC